MLCAIADSRAVSATRRVRSTNRFNPSANDPPWPTPMSTTHRYGAAVGASSTPTRPTPISSVHATMYAIWFAARPASAGSTSTTGSWTKPDTDSSTPASAAPNP